MKISVEFLLAHKSAIYEVSRVPCVGEHISMDSDNCHEVVMVIHELNAHPASDVVAIVRVK